MIRVLLRLHTSLLDVCQEISVGIAIGRCILSDHISLGVDPVARGPGCTRDIKGNVVPVSEDKPMLISGLIIVKPNHLTLGIDAGDPGESRTRKVDGSDGTFQEKAVEGLVRIDIGADNAAGIDNHGGECSLGTWEI